MIRLAGQQVTRGGVAVWPGGVLQVAFLASVQPDTKQRVCIYSSGTTQPTLL